MNCQSCKKALQGDFKFCPHCGADVKQGLTCPSCQNKVDPAWVTCPFCGTALKGTAPQHVPPQQAPWPQQPYQQEVYGHHYGSSSSRQHRKRKGFLGHLFSS